MYQFLGKLLCRGGWGTPWLLPPPHDLLFPLWAPWPLLRPYFIQCPSEQSGRRSHKTSHSPPPQLIALVHGMHLEMDAGLPAPPLLLLSHIVGKCSLSLSCSPLILSLIVATLHGWGFYADGFLHSLVTIERFSLLGEWVTGGERNNSYFLS